MKILITETSKIISFGEFVWAKDGNTVADTEKEETTVALWKEFAAINEINVTAKKKADIVSQIEAHIVEHNNEVTEMEHEQLAEQIISEGFAAEKTDDEMKEAMIIQGIPYGIMNKMFKETVERLGLRVSPKERNAKAAEFLEGYTPDINDVNSHLAKISELQDFLDCKTTQAGASMRKWAKDNKIELPKAPATPTVSPGYRGNPKIVADWALQNENCTFDELVKYASESVPKTKGDKDNSRSVAIAIWNALIFAKALNADEVVEDDVETAENEEMVA